MNNKKKKTYYFLDNIWVKPIIGVALIGTIIYFTVNGLTTIKDSSDSYIPTPEELAIREEVKAQDQTDRENFLEKFFEDNKAIAKNFRKE